jgi:hypothetical protein
MGYGGIRYIVSQWVWIMGLIRSGGTKKRNEKVTDEEG